MKLRTMSAVVLILSYLPSVPADTSADLDTNSLSLGTTAYDMTNSIDYDDSRMTNRCSMTIKNTADFPIDCIPLQLFRLLSVESVVSSTDQALKFRQSIETYRDWDKMQANSVVVTLQQFLSPGKETTITIYYGGYLTGYTETGMLYVRDKLDRDFTILRPDCKAFPEIGVASYKVNRRAGDSNFSYRISVTVPKPFVVVNGGRLVERNNDDSLTTFLYENILPAWRIDIAIGNYRVLEGSGIRVFCFESDSLGGVRILNKANEALGLYADWFGPLTGC